MKKLFSFIITTFISIGTAISNPIMGGGFVDTNSTGPQITSVNQAYGLRDDTPVLMQGKIVKSLGHEKYTFMDDTGTITVEIDDDEWHGVTITPETTVQIYGEVDKGLFKKTKIDVDSINIKL